MELKKYIEKILTELNKSKASKDTKNEIESTLNTIEKKWNEENAASQKKIMELQTIVIKNQDEYINKLELLINKGSYEEKETGKRTYSMVVRDKTLPIPKPNHAILISSKEDKSAEDIKRILKNKINVPKLGIGVMGLKKTYQNKILLTCEKQRDTETIKKEIKKHANIGIDAEEIKKKNPCIIIKGVDSEYNERELLTDLTNQNEDIKKAIKEESEINCEPIIIKKNEE